MKKSLILLLGGLIALSAILASCSNDKEVDKAAPALPPESTLVADFGNFPQNESGRVDFSRNNVGFAALNVIFWQSILTVDLAIPVAAFKKAFENDFQYLNDEDRWLSTYTVTVGDQTITASLYAEYISGGSVVKWDMYLSNEGTFEDFLWFTGESQADGSGGTWVLYKSPDQNREMLEVSWERNVDGQVTNSNYILVDEQAENEGSTIQYGETDLSGFTHYYDVSILAKSSDNYELNILFNEETKVGRVKSEAHFGDTFWHCWDENLDDVTCPL